MAVHFLRVALVVPSLDDEASGPTYSVQALVRALSKSGVEAVIATSSYDARPDKDPVHFFKRLSFPKKLGRSPEMLAWLREQAEKGCLDIVHNNGLWMMPNIYPGWTAKRYNLPLVMSPRGTLAKTALGRSRLLKSMFWKAAQRRAVASAAMFHATAEKEIAEIRRLGFRQPMALIPNGVDVDTAVGTAPTKAPDDRRVALFLGRIHPIKGVDDLLHAWAPIQGRHPQWDLRLVGPGEPAYVAKLRALASTLQLRNVHFVGSLYGDEKHQAYRESDLFVLPTHSENFGIAVAEALAAGIPVVTTRGAPWEGLQQRKAGWWIDIGVEPLTTALDEAFGLQPAALKAMGASGRNWMIQDFSWSEIATKMLCSYEWILNGGARPEWIVVD